MTKLELERRILKRLTDTASALWPTDAARRAVAEEVASHYPAVQGAGKWRVVEQVEASSAPGAHPVHMRQLFAVELADDIIFSRESRAEATAVAEALNYIETGGE